MEEEVKDEKKKYFLHPGYVFVSQEPYWIQTVLGSCVAICIWDKMRKFGGMNHFVFPSAKDSPNGRYGNVSIPYLFQMMKKLGSKKRDLEIHVLGGSMNEDISSNIGPLNVEFAENWLKKYNIPIVSRDTGGQLGRKVIFDNSEGEIIVYKLKKIRTEDWYGK